MRKLALAKQHAESIAMLTEDLNKEFDVVSSNLENISLAIQLNSLE
jgi:hypothetical protein